MLRIKTKPYTEKQLKHFSDLNYNNIYGTLLEEEHILNSIDADLPTTEEYFYRKLKYRAMIKPWKVKLENKELTKFLIHTFYTSIKFLSSKMMKIFMFI
jgi:hypothetical protein